MAAKPHLFRQRDLHDHSPVTYIELFFDLVFVFAITQLSHRLLSHLTPHGALETLVLFFAIWWVWIFTSWVTNWLDPERGNVRLMLIAMMIGGLVLSSALPDAFGRHGPAFAITYVVMQTGRTLYMIWAAHGLHTARFMNFSRIGFWFLLAAPFWLIGAYSHVDQRLWFWATALAIEYAGPFLLFRTPILGRSSTSDWDISGGHMAERCALFIIIALGEAVLVTGATFAELAQDTGTWIAFITSFIGSAAMWWIYFDVGAKRASEMISHADNAGVIARNAYTYLHMPIVAGIIISAVSYQLVMARPFGESTLSFLLTTILGPASFLIGNQLFKWATAGVKYPPLSHLIGEILLAVVLIGGSFFGWAQLSLAIGATAALLATAIWEWFSLNGGWQRWMPWLGRFGFRWLPQD